MFSSQNLYISNQHAPWGNSFYVLHRICIHTATGQCGAADYPLPPVNQRGSNSQSDQLNTGPVTWNNAAEVVQICAEVNPLTGCSLQSLPHTVSSQHYSQSPVCWRFRWEVVLSQHPSRRQKSSQRTAKLKDILKSQSRFLMSFSSFRMRLDSGSGEVTWERLVDMDMGAPEALPMTADTGILARYISISMLCSARRKPCECKEKVKVEVSAQDQNYPWKMTFSYYHQENIKLQVILV